MLTLRSPPENRDRVKAAAPSNRVLAIAHSEPGAAKRLAPAGASSSNLGSKAVTASQISWVA